MSKTESLHYKLCCEGAKWMRKQKWSSYKIVAIELCTVNAENLMYGEQQVSNQ